MSDRDALLAAVLAAPDDDLPRLVYADYLDESGEPALVARAAFIRLQVEAERRPPDSLDRAALDRDADALLALHGAGWAAELPDWVTWHDTAVGYRRGFVESLTTTPRRLSRDAHTLFAVAPVVDLRVRASHLMLPVATDTSSDPPFLARVRTLTIGWALRHVVGAPGSEFDRALAYFLTASRNLTQLRRIVARNIHLDDAWVVRFAAGFATAAFAGTLTELELEGNVITDAGANTLAAARGLDRLSRLDLTGNHIGPAGQLLLRRRFGDRVVL